MTKITHIFLDFDGVLNTSGTYKRWRAAGGDLDDPDYRHYRLDLLFEPRCIAAANLLVEYLDHPDIVLSTYWRKEHELDYLRELLASVGFVGNVVDKTPSLAWEIGWGGRTALGRGAEIAEWAKKRGLTMEQFLILEDEKDVAPFRSRQLKTSFNGNLAGFGPRHLRHGLRLGGIDPLPTNKELYRLVLDRLTEDTLRLDASKGGVEDEE